MSTILTMAEEIARGLRQALPKVCQTVVRKLALAVGAMVERRTPNTSELANVLPLETERADMREQGCWVWGSVIGDRALPLTWQVEAGSAHIGFSKQKVLLERVRDGLPAATEVMPLADRYSPSIEGLTWVQAQGWHYRFRLKGNPNVDPGVGDLTTPRALATGQTERYPRDVRLFDHGVPTHLGILHEAGHPKPWIIAMDDIPNRATVRDYHSRGGVEPLLSDLKSRGFDLEATPLRDPERLDRLLLSMALAPCMGACGQAWKTSTVIPQRSKKSRRANGPTAPYRTSSGNSRFCYNDSKPGALTAFLSHLHNSAKLIGGELRSTLKVLGVQQHPHSHGF